MKKGRIENRVGEILKERGMSAYRLVQLSNLSEGTVYPLRAKPSSGMTCETLAALCGALDCEPSDLLKYISESKK